MILCQDHVNMLYNIVYFSFSYTAFILQMLDAHICSTRMQNTFSHEYYFVIF